MHKVFKCLLALVFTTYSLLSPFWILCHKPGPHGHDRLELAWAPCCQDDSDHAEPSCNSAHGKFPCASQPEGCDQCHDERIHASPVRVPSDAQPLFLAPPVPVLSAFLSPPHVFPLDGPASSPDPSGDPPLFLAHCSFLI